MLGFLSDRLWLLGVGWWNIDSLIGKTIHVYVYTDIYIYMYGFKIDNNMISYGHFQTSVLLF